MYKKGILTALFILASIFISTPYSFANTQFKVNNNYYWINGQPERMDAQTFLEKGRVYVPVRYLALGVEVPSNGIKWDPNTDTVILSKNNTNVLLTINNSVIYINGKPIKSDVPPLIRQGRTYLPARIIAEAFGYTISWDDKSQTVNISVNNNQNNVNNSLNKKKLSTTELVKLIQPSTVLIQTSRGSGSGFFVDTSGKVVTNAHVVRGSKWINITTYNGNTYTAFIDKINNSSDLAIIQLDAKPWETFKIIDYYVEAWDVEIGEEILVFGNPIGLAGTVTRGIVSAKRQWYPSEAWLYPIDIIQHDATISFGSSGGPVVNQYGEFIGINFSGHIYKDFSFAVPAQYYYYLAEYGQTYGLKDDWYSFWTESWEWEKSLNYIFSHVDITNAYSVSIHLNELIKLKDEVSSYEPKYAEIQSIKRYLLESITADINLFEYSIKTLNNPYIWNESTSNQLFNNSIRSNDIYLEEKAKIDSRFRNN
ncbi:MAG: trypsin-like peptidase domain-containing protein [Clostridia bacterium]|nr:trypsin-like peptidase domain-containing protein [Clostridia bacterium]